MNNFFANPIWSNEFSSWNINPNPPNRPKVNQHSQGPVTTATSIIAFAFDKGVIMAGDILASYGSLARYLNCPRIVEVNQSTCLGASGDYGDFQTVNQLITQKVNAERILDDNFNLSPKSLHCWLTRVMYDKRSKFDPFWNNFIVAGMENCKPYIGSVDKLGTAFTDEKVICTGFAAHLAQPILREELKGEEPIDEEKARCLVDKSMEILYYRDARSWPLFQRAIITEDGVRIEEPEAVGQNWTVAHFVG